MAAAVAGGDAALGEAVGVELVEESDEAAGHHAEAGGEGLLGEAGVGGEDVEDACMGGGEFEPGEVFCEFVGGVTAELGEEKSGAEGAAGGWAGTFFGPGGFHASIIAWKNHSMIERFLLRTTRMVQEDFL